MKNPICSIFYLAPLPSTDVSTGLWWSNTPAFNISNRPPRCAASPCLKLRLIFWVWQHLTEFRYSIWSPMVIDIMVIIMKMVFLHNLKKISLQSPPLHLDWGLSPREYNCDQSIEVRKCKLRGKHLEETYENTHWRKVKQMQPFWASEYKQLWAEEGEVRKCKQPNGPTWLS